MAAAPPTPQGPIWYGATVLAVDDDLSLRGILRRMLEAEGFHVEEASDDESALRLDTVSEFRRPDAHPD